MERDHAVVIGGSVAGLLAARVAAEQYGRVTIVDRDAPPAAPAVRRGVPQGAHVHGLLAGGLRALEHLFPGFTHELRDAGALIGDVGTQFSFFQFGAWKVRATLGFETSFQTRPLLDWLIHRKVVAPPAVTWRGGAPVDGLVGDARRVRGVSLAGGEVLNADLVVDASGRGSRCAEWLEGIGGGAPRTTEVKVWVGYASRLYRRRATAPFVGALVFPEPPARRAGALFPVEGDRWVCTLGGWLHDHPPADERGFLAFAESLPTPELWDVVRHEEPLSPIRTHRVPSNQRRHLEALHRAPENFLVTGDALASFNPVYGQGIAVAALEAIALARCLQQARDGVRLARRFHRAAARLVEAAWGLATTEDLRYPEAEGRRSPTLSLLQPFVERISRRASVDREVLRRFYRVIHMLSPPASLLAPGMLGRLFASRARSDN